MNLKEYQEFTASTAVYPPNDGIPYCTLGLTSEAGEVAGKVKKWMRDGAPLTPLYGELGDVLWYISQLCNELGWSLEDVLKHNVQKLSDRKERNVIRGDGDDR